MNPQKIMDVFAINDTAHAQHWPLTKIGVAFVNQDDSINVVLDLFPRFGKILIQPRATKPKKEKQ